MLRLRIETTENTEIVALTEDEIIVGRGEDADIRVDEPRASRTHLSLRPGTSGAVLRDLGSTNGTMVGDRRVLQCRIAPGDSFRIGETTFALLADEPAPRRFSNRRAVSIVLTLFAPALALLLLGQIALSAIGTSRDQKIARARQTIELADLTDAQAAATPEASLAALRAFLRTYPESEFTEQAAELARRLGPRVAQLEDARRDLGRLEAVSDRLAYRELRFRYEKLLLTYAAVPEVAGDIGKTLRELDESHREMLLLLVDEVRAEASTLAEGDQFGRALSVMISFTAKSPSAAAQFEVELREVERDIMERAIAAYREVLARADKLAADGKGQEGVDLLRAQTARFNGMRFNAFLKLRADGLLARISHTGVVESEDHRQRRQSYYLAAQEAEELAAAGLFSRAAKKYAGILESVKIDEIREEFAVRETELRNMASLLEGLKKTIAERGEKFGTVRFGKAAYKVRGMAGDILRLEYRKQDVDREWGSLTPEEILALARKARMTPVERLVLAVYCFDMNLREAWQEEILGALEDNELRGLAGRLLARKEGRSHPEGGFVAHKGRILTRSEHAEEVYREQVLKLRERQVRVYERLRKHPLFAKRLVKFLEMRAELERTRAYALALIYDEVTYFYPYRSRMGEYTPVQKEVDIRVDAVREIWDDPYRVTFKVDSGLKSILKDVDKVNSELEALGADTGEYRDAVDEFVMYLGRTLTIRTFFIDEGDRQFNEYNRRVMEWNEEVEGSANTLERRQVEITNEYRMMLGRRALVLDDRLVKTAHGHSEEMSRLGYFSHTSPVKGRETPDRRAALEGYRASAISENIHAGSGMPEGADYGWRHSSGHHRNLLQKFWTEMGTGQSGRYWTQNFGRTKLKRFDTRPDGGK